MWNTYILVCFCVHKCSLLPFICFSDLIGFPFHMLSWMWSSCAYVLPRKTLALPQLQVWREGRESSDALPDWPRNGLDLVFHTMFQVSRPSLKGSRLGVLAWFVSKKGNPLVFLSLSSPISTSKPFPIFPCHAYNFSYTHIKLAVSCLLLFCSLLLTCPSGLLGFVKSCWLSMMASRLHFVVTPRPILQNRGHAAHKRQILSSSFTITSWPGFSLQQITPHLLSLSISCLIFLCLCLYRTSSLHNQSNS